MPGTVWQTKEKTIWHDIQKNEKFLRRNAGIAINLNTVKGIPLLCKDEIIGALLLGSTYEIFEDKNNAIFYRGLSETLGSEIQRKHVEQELSEIFNTASDIICIAGFDGYYKKVNPYMCELLGYTEEELLSNPFLNFVHPDDIDITSNEAENLKFGESKLTFENRYKTKDGRIIWLSWTSKPNYDTNLIYAIAKDITEKKELEVLLKNTNELAKNGSMEINFIDNTAYYSEITFDILDLPRETIPYFGLGISFFKEGANRNKIESVIKDAVDNGVPWDQELEIITAKGNHKWIRTIGNSEFRNGKCARLFGSFQDITDKKKTEIELQTLNEVLEERALKLQQSNEELEQFAYVASHDLQEPLRMVTSFMSLLEKKYTDKLDDKGKEYIHFAVDGAKRMRQIILDLLEFSRVGRTREELDRIDLNILTQGILQFNREKIDEVGAIIRMEKLPIIYSYETPVYQVLQNLVSNSLKYHSTTEQPIIDITVKEQENDWLFCIKDNGLGIDPAYHAKIFQLFQRLHTKNEYSGSGIGLSLCKKIIDDLKGKIWLESEENKGSAFYFTLPKLNEL
jgi:PAS domain S-box-containing protein